ncbi:hypothetical protein L218DRAFT_947387 [Marasmius fiardii PR-910]|nr:hypothetical protein L218DRAFT_947387 [Marasmius fiardii PR-910]
MVFNPSNTIAAQVTYVVPPPDVPPSTYQAYFDDIKELEEYYRESTEIVKEVTGASRVILYDPLQRRRRTGEEDSDTVKKRKPAGQVHVDVSLSAAFSHIHRYAPTSEASKLLSSRRFQVINLWRPINNPAFDWPVAFCVWDSVDVERDTFSVPRLRPESLENGDGVTVVVRRR